MNAVWLFLCAEARQPLAGLAVPPLIVGVFNGGV
jgi:hypothetical protein